MSAIVFDDGAMISCSAARDLAPSILDPIREVLERTGIGILGTVRRDGSPRVSPIEISVQDGDLFVGMMPDSAKARDAFRDGRCCVLTPVADRNDLGGEGKLFGRLVPLDGDDAEARLRVAAQQAGFDPELVRGSPAFELRIDGAAWQRVDGETWTTLSWRLGEAVRLRHRRGATELPVDVPIG
jgi:hypothetical protein